MELWSATLGKAVARACCTQLENFFPCRDDLMLLLAGLQCASIGQAARVVGYDVFPSFYGSEFVYSPRLRCVAPVLAPASEVDGAALGETLGAYAEIVRSHPDIEWVFYPVDYGATSEGNPTSGLVSNPESYDLYWQATRDGLPDAAAVLYDPCQGIDEFYRTRYATDHHWNIDGAVEGFGLISRALGMEEVELGEKVVASSDEFYGSYARQSLCLDCADDGIEDVAYDISGLRVWIDGEEVDPSYLDYAVQGTYEKKFVVDNLYGACFHGDYALIEIVNDAVDGGTLLIVGDSYSNPIERFFTSAYRRVVVYDPRQVGALPLEEVIDTYSPDTVVSIQGAKGFFAEDRLQGILYGRPLEE